MQTTSIIRRTVKIYDAETSTRTPAEKKKQLMSNAIDLHVLFEPFLFYGNLQRNDDQIPSKWKT